MTGGADSVGIYDRALDHLLRFHPAVVEDAGTLVATSLDAPMGHALTAYLHLMSTDAADLPTASEAVAAVQGCAEHPRELAHADAAAGWLAGDWTGAATHVDDLLRQWPTDLLALAIGHQLDFFLGDATNLRDRVGRTGPEVDPDHAHAGFVLGMHAFGLEESGHYAQAEAAGVAALARNRDDVWAIHAVVHTYEMRGRIDTGTRFLLDRTDDWADGNLFTVHNWWHLALFALEAGEPSRALAIYDDRLHTPSSAGVPSEMLDAAALLWRLHLDDVPTGDRFAVLADGWARCTTEDPRYAFNDVHAVMALAGAGRLDDCRAVIAGLSAYVERAQGTNASMTAGVGLPVARAVLAFVEGRHADVVAELEPIRRVLNHFGGSHAQRDAWQRILLESSLRCGRNDLARALTAERLSMRGQANYNWVQRARVLDALGDANGAGSAAATAESNRVRFTTAFQDQR